MRGYNNSRDDPNMMAGGPEMGAMDPYMTGPTPMGEAARPRLRVNLPPRVGTEGDVATANLLLRALQGGGGQGAGWGGLGGLFGEALTGAAPTFQHSQPSFMLNMGGPAEPRGENNVVQPPYRGR